MNSLNLIHYCHPDCEPLRNILRLPESEAFQLASQLAAAHPDTTAFYRFADFQNYYPRRMAADRLLHSVFISRGGKPTETHPLSFVLQGSDYLDRWFGQGKVLRLPLQYVSADQISFTLGDSLSTLENTGGFSLLTLDELRARIADHPQGAAGFMQAMQQQFHYIEAQLWDDAPCRFAESIR